MICEISSIIIDRILKVQNAESNTSKAEVCLGGKLSLFLDISQNSISEKRILHKIQYQKIGLFTKIIIQA